MSKNKKPTNNPDTNKKVVKTFTPEHVSKVIRSHKADITPSKLLSDIAKLWNEYEASDGKNEELVNKLNTKLDHAATLYVLENHYALAETINKDKIRTLFIEMTNQLIEEYDCKTTSERMLAQTAGWSYSRMIEYGGRLNNLLEIEFLSSEKNGFYSLLSREVDRSTRQYITALTTLKHLKQPPVRVSFKAKNAFVAQNQQINADSSNSSKEKIDEQ